MASEVDRLQSLGMALANASVQMKASVKKIEESLETIIMAMNLEQQRDDALAEIEHFRRGIEAYRANWKAANCCLGECDCEFDEADNHEEQWAASSDAVIKWEEIDKRWRESGDG